MTYKIWQIINEIVENQEERKRLSNYFKPKDSYFLILNFLYFISISVNCLRCRMKGFQQKCDSQTYRHAV